MFVARPGAYPRVEHLTEVSCPSDVKLGRKRKALAYSSAVCIITVKN